MKISDPLVSIIIPTFNRAHLIGETLDSIMAQTYQNWECIVVDDGSTDNTPEVMAEYVKRDSRIQYHHRPTNHKPGGNGARNYGFKLSKGEYVNWFDSDDLMHPMKLKLQIQSLIRSALNFTVCQTVRFEGNVKNLLGFRHPKIHSQDTLNDFIKQKIVFLTSAPLLKKTFLQHYNLFFDENLKAAQEWDFFVKVLEKQSKYEVINAALVYHRKHSKSISYSEDKKSESVRLWNNFIVRYNLLQRTELPIETKNYLFKKNIKIFKVAVRKRFFKEALKIYIYFILKEQKLSRKMKAGYFAGLISYILLGRGDKLLKINFN